MINLDAITEEINALENDAGSLQDLRNLASLYIIRQERQNAIQRNPDALESELQDILPAYRIYCRKKRQYQMQEISDDYVMDTLKSLCAEIKDFIRVLYSGTDLNKERKQILQLLEELHKEFCCE